MKRVHTKFRTMIIYKTPVGDYLVFKNVKECTFTTYDWYKSKKAQSKYARGKLQ